MARTRDATDRLVTGASLLGILLAAGVAVAWLLLFLDAPTQGTAVAAGLAALVYGGKETGIPVGLAAGATPLQMGLFIFFADAAFALVVYAIVHYAVESWAARPGPVGRFLRRTQTRARRHAPHVQRYGAVGLFLFMLIPFAFNGPLLGAVVGRLIGLAATRILPILVFAVAFTTALWTTLYAIGFRYAAKLDPDLPLLVASLALTLATASILVGVFWGGRKEPRGRRETASP